jgi:(p)ppGpp synthase/HD superfamily hydrolase
MAASEILDQLNEEQESDTSMATIEKALQIAAKAHEGQKDKSGGP